MMNIWWCNQSNYWTDEYDAGVVCSQAGSQQPKFREMVSRAQKDDLVVHYRKSLGVVAVSRAKADAVTCVSKSAICLYGRGWAFPTEYHLLAKPVKRSSFIDALATVANIDGPMQALSNGGHRIRQAYFMPFTREGLKIVHRAAAPQHWPSWINTGLGL